MVLERAVFTVDGRSWSFADVVLAGYLTGRWTRVEREVAAGASAIRRVALAGTAERPAIRAAESEFRRARKLLAADDLRAWLDRFGLTVEGWREHLRRRLARELLGEEPVDDLEPLSPGRDAADARPPATSVWTEAVCSGDLAGMCRRLARGVAADLVERSRHTAVAASHD